MSNLVLLVNILLGIYALGMTYAFLTQRMVSIASRVWDCMITIAMMFVVMWYLSEKFPWVAGCALVATGLVYIQQEKLQARGRAKMK